MRTANKSPAELLPVLTREAERMLPRMQPKGLMNVLWACAFLPYRPQRLLQDVLREAQKQMRSFGLEDLEKLAVSLTKLRHKPPSSFLSEMVLPVLPVRTRTRTRTRRRRLSCLPFVWRPARGRRKPPRASRFP